MLGLRDIERIADGLLDYGLREEWRGHDPYDALNSQIFQSSPLRRSQYARLVWIQFGKRSPINFRDLLSVPKTVNPKGLALFLSGILDLYRRKEEERYRVIAESLVLDLKRIQTTGYAGACWGYPFDWQARAFFLPKWTPTIVVTSYVANALLNAYTVLEDQSCLEMARSSCNFFLSDLNRHESADGLCFSYSPKDNSQVHNASVLGATLLARVGEKTGKTEWVDVGESGIRYSIHHQLDNGSWHYGLAKYQKWTDNFHTGFMLECIHDFMTCTGRDWPAQFLTKGLEFYRNHLFRLNGIPRYYYGKTYPIDVHSFAQGILTFAKLVCFDPSSLTFSDRILQRAVESLRHPSGFFCYQKSLWYKNQIPYMRWGQAWMFRALSANLLAHHNQSIQGA